MSGWLLDTNVLIDLVLGAPKTVEQNFAAAVAASTPIHLSSISLFGFRFGAERSRRRDFQLAALERFLLRVAVVDFDQADASIAALLKASLAARGRPIDAFDVLIAAQALSRNLTVATAKLREFARVEGLKVRDWRATA